MNSCGKVLGSSMGYRKLCGGLWMGDIAQCDFCRSKDLEDEKNRLLIKKLNNDNQPGETKCQI